MSYTPLSKIFYSDNQNYEAIYQSRYNGEHTVHMDFFINDDPAFFVCEPSVYSDLVDIYRADKQIKALCDNLPGEAIDQFAKRCLVDEIILSNDIEGVYSSRKEINSVLSELKNHNKTQRFWGLVQKYFMLQNTEHQMSFATCEDIRSLYNDLVYSEIKADDPNNLPDGKIFRKDCASVVSSTQKELHRGINPESKIIEYMNKALAILDDNDIEFLFRVSVFHYLFGYIHPFYDGNGRTSRFISSYLLSKEFEPILGYRISYTIKENIKDYYNAFKICNDTHNKGDLTPFIIMFVGIIKTSMHQLVDALKKRRESLEYYLGLMHTLPFGLNIKYTDLYNYLIQASLFSESGISTGDLIELLGVSRTTLSNRISELSKHGLIIKNAYRNNRYYKLDLDKADKISKK